MASVVRRGLIFRHTAVGRRLSESD